jgi:hypothetical protein
MEHLFTTGQWASLFRLGDSLAEMRAAGFVDDLTKIVVGYMEPNPGLIEFARFEQTFFSYHHGSGTFWRAKLNRGQLDVDINPRIVGPRGLPLPTSICITDTSALWDFILGEPVSTLKLANGGADAVMNDIQPRLERFVRHMLCTPATVPATKSSRCAHLSIDAIFIALGSTAVIWVLARIAGQW